jgi:aromatic-L-amino-acid/L-tryptophan decarboxylase
MREATLDLPDEELGALLEAARALAEQEIRAAREGPIFSQPPSAERLAPLIGGDLPLEGEPLGDLLGACGQVLAAGRRTAPGFFGYVHSPPSPLGVAADLLASAADQNVTAWRSAPAATEVERVALRWLGALAGFADAEGILLSGGSMANLTALLIALRAATEPEPDRRLMRAYASEETHFSVAKAADVLGIGLRSVAVDGDQRIDIGALRAAIAEDRGEGLRPFCVVGSAGTVATGAVDRLDELAAVAADEGLWFHVDGAYGALAAADPGSRPLFAGMELANSLALDPHKWLYVPMDCGALLVRDEEAVARAFGVGAGEYVRVLADEGVESYAFWEHGLELSRRFRGLKVWMTLRYYGARRIAATIAEDIALARHLADRVRTEDDMELLAGPSLSICCFRHRPAGVAESELDHHNERLLAALQRDGRFYLSNARVGGRLALRACITNFRTTRADVERLVSIVRALGESAGALRRP